MQWDESEGKSRDDAFYGGAGYGGSNSRPDLSNTAFFMEALRDTGLPADDPSLKKALVFVSRCQNLKGEFNDQAWAAKVNDGGFIYTAAKGGESMAGKTEDGGLRSYASMTYAGLKSMIYAGLDRNDPRVKAALTYITQHYTLDENPGLGPAGPVLLLPHLRQDDGRARRADPDRRRGQSRTTGRPSWSRRWRSGSSPTAAGSTPPTGSWKATPTWSPPMPCWRWPTRGRSEHRRTRPARTGLDAARRSALHRGRMRFMILGGQAGALTAGIAARSES